MNHGWQHSLASRVARRSHRWAVRARAPHRLAAAPSPANTCGHAPADRRAVAAAAVGGPLAISVQPVGPASPPQGGLPSTPFRTLQPIITTKP